MPSEASLVPRLVGLALAGAGCSPPDLAKPIPPAPGVCSVDTGPSKASYAIVRITRTLVYDDHPSSGGNLPDIDLNTMRIILDYGKRTPDTQPVIRTYTVRVAVPNGHARSWDLHLGDDYNLLLVTRGFTGDAKSIKIDGRVKSDYQLQLAEDSAPIGPNEFAFPVQAVGERTAVQVLNDEGKDRIFREFDETVIEDLTDTPPALPSAGIDESQGAQLRRWDEWPLIRKRGLR